MQPLRFRPLLKRYVWGGRRLATALGKQLPPGNDYAESWEVCDRADDQSVVLGGPLAGATLGQLVREHGRALLGRHVGLPRFPLLWKFLDAHDRLSVQVHPTDETAGQLDPPDLGKTEAWVILHAEPGSLIYAGLVPGCDRAAFERALRAGTCASCLHQFEPRAGDCVFLPAGTIHALGAGLVVAEVQQSSNVTYRLFDWNRVGADGQSRPLHIDSGLAVADFDSGPIAPQAGIATEDPQIERLVECDKFTLERWSFDGPKSAGGDDRCRIVALLSGSLAIEGDPLTTPLAAGDVALLPAASGPVRLTPHGATVMLCAYLP